MQYERVHTVWHYHDGVRTGIADLRGAPHYFCCQFDQSADEYSDNFKIYSVGPEFMQRAIRYAEIFRAWRHKVDNGAAHAMTHPGLPGIDAEYTELQAWFHEQISSLHALPMLYKADFRALLGQEGLPSGSMRELEVAWSPSISDADKP